MQCTLKRQKSTKLQAPAKQQQKQMKEVLNYFVFDGDKWINMETNISKMFIQMQ